MSLLGGSSGVGGKEKEGGNGGVLFIIIAGGSKCSPTMILNTVRSTLGSDIRTHTILQYCICTYSTAVLYLYELTTNI